MALIMIDKISVCTNVHSSTIIPMSKKFTTCSNMYNIAILSTKENMPNVIIFIGKVSMLRILLRTELINQKINHNTPNIMYVSLYIELILSPNSGT